MAVQSPVTADLEARRAELDAVLQSSYFTRAPKLAHLLSYLCEKLFAGEACQIKEYSIGVELFHRGSSFDQDSDSIVRVEANRLRKRLAEYYATEGASHRVHINIPVGQYVPEFEIRAENPPAEALPAAAAEASSPTDRFERTAKWPWLPKSRTWWLVAAVSIPILASAVFLLRQRKPQPAADQGSQTVAQPAEAQFGLPMGEEVRILAGASRSFVDHAGKLWNADSGFQGGMAVKSPERHFWRTQDPDFYRTSRQGQFRYKIPLRRGIYELRLHFAETIYGPESSGTGGEGSRILTVRVNGKPLLNHFDVVADAGASRTVDVKVFPGISPAADGFLYLDFAGEDGKQATLSAIEILPGVRGRIRPVRLLARQTPYYSNDSHWWSPDDYFQGGLIATYAAPVTGTDDPEMYESERWGNFSYAIPVSPGKYAVTLYFAARHGNWNEPAGSTDEKSPPAHIFNVFCNGTALLSNFDLLKEARQGDVVIRKFAALEPNAQGKLMLSFVPVEGYASITGIEVIPQ